MLLPAIEMLLHAIEMLLHTIGMLIPAVEVLFRLTNYEDLPRRSSQSPLADISYTDPSYLGSSPFGFK